MQTETKHKGQIMRSMSLAQYRASVRIVGEKSALFVFKKEIFEALDMGLSHEQIHYFLTTQKGLKMSVRAVSKWIKIHKKQSQKPTISSFAPPKTEVQKQQNSGIKKQNEVVNQPKVEPTSTTAVDDRASAAKAKLEAEAAKAGIDLSDLPQGLYSMFAHQILE